MGRVVWGGAFGIGRTNTRTLSDGIPLETPPPTVSPPSELVPVKIDGSLATVMQGVFGGGGAFVPAILDRQ